MNLNMKFNSEIHSLLGKIIDVGPRQSREPFPVTKNLIDITSVYPITKR